MLNWNIYLIFDFYTRITEKHFRQLLYTALNLIGFFSPMTLIRDEACKLTFTVIWSEMSFTPFYSKKNFSCLQLFKGKLVAFIALSLLFILNIFGNATKVLLLNANHHGHPKKKKMWRRLSISWKWIEWNK